jgi:Mg2+/Co2+ transporter CorB
MHAYLEFERPIAELEGKIVELRKLAEEDPTMDIEDDVGRLQAKARQLIHDTYAKLTPWQKAMVARHPSRPHFLDYANSLFEEFSPLAGDRVFGEDRAIVTGLGRFRGKAVAITTVVMTAIVLVFAEVLPKTLAIARTERFALAVASVLRPVVTVLAPVVDSVQFVVWRILRIFGLREEAQPPPLLPPHEQIRGTVELHHKEGTVEREHRDMIGGILDLAELKVGDVMVHRKSMETLDAGMPAAELFESLLAANHSRVPVWRDSPDNIIGVLQAKEAMRAYVGRRGQMQGFDVLSLLGEPWFVPETTALEELLDAFRSRRSHFALVVDEYGTLQGLVTLTDVLNQIFGDIPDEPAIPTPPKLRPLADDSYIIEGVTPVRELNRELDWNLPDEEATTIAGLVIHEARTIPDVGQRFAFYGFKFEILRRQRNQITLLRVTPPTPPAAEAAT